ncbi:MAG: 50S ribosomal protein L9 [Schleiferiaceae bacterium]|jgi:large subunit ribosomal protein L9|nr:50S ribosomal protein L9 [Schleiferiaceae bacterium]
MELILTQDVENVGFKDDIVSVKNGYGRNYLIPRGFGVLATTSAKKVLAENLKQRAHKEAKIVEDAKKTSEALKNLEIKITVKAGANGKLFGAVSNANLADELAKAGHNIERKFIQITGGTVKSLGKYNATIRLHRDVIVEKEFEVAAQDK